MNNNTVGGMGEDEQWVDATVMKGNGGPVQ